jgi:hypothetical protein
MSTLAVTNIQSNSSTAPVVFQTNTGTEIGQLCRAWVNFNGTTSPGTIRASFNVSSVTKNGTGDYTVNFTNALVDANCSTVVCGTGIQRCFTVVSNTASATRIFVNYPNGGAGGTDETIVTVAVFR